MNMTQVSRVLATAGLVTLAVVGCSTDNSPAEVVADGTSAATATSASSESASTTTPADSTAATTLESLPSPSTTSILAARPGGTVSPGVRVQFDIYAHCGVKVLGKLNGTWWITAESGSDAYEWLPAEWAVEPGQVYGSLTAVLLMSPDEGTITATFRDRSVVYRPEVRGLAELAYSATSFHPEMA